MRFMMFMIPKVYQPGEKADAAFTPNAELVKQMMKYNEDLAKGGHLMALDGLQPPANGARVSFAGGKPTVTDGPFVEAKEFVGGYWMLQFKSKEEAVEWARRCPAQPGDVLEIRPVFEMSDFSEDAQKAGDNQVVKAAVEKHKR